MPYQNIGLFKIPGRPSAYALVVIVTLPDRSLGEVVATRI
jgi:hypothetical protein